MKKLIALLGAVALTLSMVAPTFAYQHHLGLQIHFSRLDPLTCGTQIRIGIDVVDFQGHVVPNKSGKLVLRWQHRAADRVGPNLGTPYSEMFLTDGSGRAQSTEAAGLPWVMLACKTGPRVLRASIYNTSGGILVRKTYVLNCRQSCVN